jgi:hypothetical protein
MTSNDPVYCPPWSVLPDAPRTGGLRLRRGALGARASEGCALTGSCHRLSLPTCFLSPPVTFTEPHCPRGPPKTHHTHTPNLSRTLFPSLPLRVSSVQCR